MTKRFLFVLFMLVPASAFANAPIKVVASFSILGDLTKQVGGGLVDVTSLVGPDGDAHTYKPSPGDSEALAHAGLVIENGLGLEGWIDRLIAASGYKSAIVVASKGIAPRLMESDEGPMHKRTITDPHAWQDVANARIYVKNINAALDQIRPDQAAVFDANAKAYDAELAQLDAWVKTELGAIPPGQRKIITSHDAFGYFGAAYGVTFLAPQGLSTEVEPTAMQVGKLIDQMKTEKIKRVFFETMASPKLASQIAKDAGGSVGLPIYSDALSGADGPAPTYVAMFHYNLAQFNEAMLLNGR